MYSRSLPSRLSATRLPSTCAVSSVAFTHALKRTSLVLRSTQTCQQPTMRTITQQYHTKQKTTTAMSATTAATATATTTTTATTTKAAKFSTNLTELLKRKDLTAARQQVEKMSREKVHLNEHQYTTIFRAFWNAGDTQTAERIFQEMSERGVTPDIQVFTTMVNHYTATNQLDKATQVKAHMTSHKRTRAAVMPLMDACVRTGNVQKAIRLVEEMKQQHKTPNEGIYCCLFTCLLQKGEIEKLTEYWEEMLDSGITPSTTTYNRLLSVYANVGDVANAETFFEQMLSADVAPTIATYGTLMRAHLKAEDPQRVLQYFEKLQSRGPSPDQEVYLVVLAALKKTKDLKGALQCWNSIREKGCTSNVAMCSSMIDVCCECGDLETAKKVFREMELQGLEPTAKIVNNLRMVESKQQHTQATEAH